MRIRALLPLALLLAIPSVAHAGKLAITSDGATLAVVDAIDSIRVFDTASGKVRFSLALRGDLAISPSGKLLAIASDDGVDVIDARTGETLRKLGAGTGQADTVAFSPDGKLLAAGMDWSTSNSQGTPHVEVFDPSTGASKWTADAAYGPMVAWSPDGTRLASTDLKTIRLYDVSGHEKAKYAIGTEFIAWSPDGTMIGYGGGMDLALIDASTGAELARKGYDTHDVPDHRGTTFAFSPDGWIGVPTVSGIDWYTTPDLTLKYTWQDPLAPTEEIAFGDGKLYALGDFGQLRVLDARASKVKVLGTLEASAGDQPQPQGDEAKAKAKEPDEADEADEAEPCDATPFEHALKGDRLKLLRAHPDYPCQTIYGKKGVVLATPRALARSAAWCTTTASDGAWSVDCYTFKKNKRGKPFHREGTGARAPTSAFPR